MIVWLIIAMAVAAICGTVLLFARNGRKAWSAVVAAGVLALAGYVSQGRPDVAAAPAQPVSQKENAADALLGLRAKMDTKFGPGKNWLIPADGLARDGDYKLAAAFIQSGLRQQPKNGDLWAGLGVVLMLAGNGELSQPSQLAFAKARKYAPGNPAPAYFEGLDLLFKGKPNDTVKRWQALVDAAPKNAEWKPMLESQLAGLRNMLDGEIGSEQGPKSSQ